MVTIVKKYGINEADIYTIYRERAETKIEERLGKRPLDHGFDLAYDFSNSLGSITYSSSAKEYSAGNTSRGALAVALIGVPYQRHKL